MARTWKVLRVVPAQKGKNFCVVKVEDAKDQRSPYDLDNDPHIPIMLANCTNDEAKQWARELNSGTRTLDDIRDRRRQIKNMMYSGMN